MRLDAREHDRAAVERRGSPPGCPASAPHENEVFSSTGASGAGGPHRRRRCGPSPFGYCSETSTGTAEDPRAAREADDLGLDGGARSWMIGSEPLLDVDQEQYAVFADEKVGVAGHLVPPGAAPLS